MSDQDFFFDEDEQTGKSSSKSPAKSAAKGTPARAQKSAPAAGPAAAPAASKGGSFFDQSVSMSVASLLVVIGLLVGVIVGVLVAPGQTSSSIPGPQSATTAPELTSDQIQSGELPAGHPPIDGASGSATDTAGSAETTTN